MIKRIKNWFRGSKKNKEANEPRWPVKDISLKEVRNALGEFAKEKAEGIHLNVLIKENLEIDYNLLGRFLHAIPKDTYYMSRETYELFDEPKTPKMLDQIQRAVDRYIDIEEKLPLEEGNRQMKICYYKLSPYLKDTPAFETYLTPEENLITMNRPVTH